MTASQNPDPPASVDHGDGTDPIPVRLLALAWREIALLAAMLAVAGALWIFLEIADAVSDNEPDALRALDQAILRGLRNPANPADPIGPLWLEIAARDFTSLGSAAVLAAFSLLALGYLLLIRRSGSALLLVAAVVGGQALSSALKIGFARVRPDLVPHSVDVYTASFPSGHAMLAAVIYLTIAAILSSIEPNWYRRIYMLGAAVLLVFLIGASRVYLGVHWPSDVVAGWCIGAAWAIACWMASVLLQRRLGTGGVGAERGSGVPR